MSFKNPQPGDTFPTDAPQPGDAAKLRDRDQDRGGDRAPGDAASARDEHKEDAQMAEGGTPLGGVNFSEPFIKRPVATFLLSFAILLAGAVSYKLLPVA